MSVGRSTFVWDLKTGEKPWEKYRVCIGVGCVSKITFHINSHVSVCSGEKNSTTTYLPLHQLRLNSRPRLTLRGITQQIHNNRSSLNRLVDIKEVRARHPTVLLGFFPAGAVLSHADDDVEAVVAEVETLAVALGAVADEGESVVLEVILWKGN